MAAAAGTIAILTVLIYNPGAVPEKTLARAQKVAGEILAHAGVSLSWRAARADDVRSSAVQIPLHLLTARPPRLHRDAQGFAVIQHGEDAESYAGVSYPAVVEGAQWVGGEVHLVLGAAIAHELGHVLLNSGAHSASGVMSASIRSAEIGAASRGELHFSAAEESRIRAEAMRRCR